MKFMTATRLSVRVGVTALAAAAACSTVMGIVWPCAAAQMPTEPAQVVSARYLLPPDLFAGQRFRVDDRVPTDG